MRELAALDPMRQQEIIQQPYIFAALLIMGATFVVAFFYCLDALQGERRIAAFCSGNRCRFLMSRRFCRKPRFRW